MAAERLFCVVLDASPHARRAHAAASEAPLRRWIFRGLGLRLEAARPRPTKAAAAASFAAIALLGSHESLHLPACWWCTDFAPTRAACCPDVVASCLEYLSASPGHFLRSGTVLGSACVGCDVCVHNRVRVAGIGRATAPSEADSIILSYNGPYWLVCGFRAATRHTAS